MGHIFSMRLASRYRHALCIDFRHSCALRRAAGTRRRVPSTTLAARRQHYQRGGGPPDQRLDPGSRFNAKREVREPRKNKAAEKQNFDDITEKAMKKGTSKGGWKGAEALGIDFEM